MISIIECNLICTLLDQYLANTFLKQYLPYTRKYIDNYQYYAYGPQSLKTFPARVNLFTNYVEVFEPSLVRQTKNT